MLTTVNAPRLGVEVSNQQPLAVFGLARKAGRKKFPSGVVAVGGVLAIRHADTACE